MRQWLVKPHRILVSNLIVCAVLGTLVASRASAETDPWAKHAQWMSVRAGYAKSTAEGSADGSVGLGFGYTRFLNSRWAASAHGHLELLGKYLGAAEIEIPWTAEITRHSRWGLAFRPYLGLGAGVFYHKFYRTGGDAASVRPGGYVVAGANTPIADRTLLGLDVRMIFESSEGGSNPVFGVVPKDGSSTIPEIKDGSRWSVKLNYARVF